MSKESYIRGFCKVAEEHGFDPVKLAQFSGYNPMYATRHQIGSFKDNIKAIKNWSAGNGPAMNASFATVVDKDDLKHDMSSISAPTLVDRIHNGWNAFRGGGSVYGTTDQGKPITPQEFDANVQSYRGHRTPGLRAPKPGEYDGSWMQNHDGSFSRGNTTSYPLDTNAILQQMAEQGIK